MSEHKPEGEWRVVDRLYNGKVILEWSGGKVISYPERRKGERRVREEGLLGRRNEPRPSNATIRRDGTDRRESAVDCEGKR